MRRWQRVLICLLLVCCILVNLSPLRADATSAGLAGSIAGVTAVNVPAGLVYGAAAITLGVMAGTNDDFQNLVDNAVSVAGDWVQDGCVELLRLVDEAGTASYYMAGDLLETLRQALFDGGVVVSGVVLRDGFTESVSESVSIASTYPYAFYWFTYGNHFVGHSNDGPFVLTDASYMGAGNYYLSTQNNGSISTYLNGSYSSSSTKYLRYGTDIQFFGTAVGDPLSTPYDLSLGQISTVPIDGTSARSWAGDEVADRNGLYVKYNNDPDPPDDNNGHWFWKLMLPVTAASLLAMSQADEWTGETPQEFSEYTTSQEFEILDAPEINGYQGVEIAVPGTGGGTAGDGDTGDDSQESTDPTTGGSPGTGGDTGTDSGEDTDPDTGSESDPDADPDTDPDTNPDGSDSSGGSWQPPSDHNQFALADLSKFFPFCIPFDLYDFFQLLNADPVAPVLSWEIKDLSGNSYPISIDLSEWDSVAQLFRRLQLFLFITGLAAASRKFIKW